MSVYSIQSSLDENQHKKSKIDANDVKSSEVKETKVSIPYLLIFIFSSGVYGLSSLIATYANYMNIFYTSQYGIGAYIITISLTTVNIFGLYAALFAGLKVESLCAKQQLMNDQISKLEKEGNPSGLCSTLIDASRQIGFIGWSSIASITIMCIFTVLFIIPFSAFSFPMLEFWFVITQIFLYIGYFCWQLFPMAYVYTFTSNEAILAVFFTFNNVIQNGISIFGNWECPFVHNQSFQLFQYTGFGVAGLSIVFSIASLITLSIWKIKSKNTIHSQDKVNNKSVPIENQQNNDNLDIPIIASLRSCYNCRPYQYICWLNMLNGIFNAINSNFVQYFILCHYNQTFTLDVLYDYYGYYQQAYNILTIIGCMIAPFLIVYFGSRQSAMLGFAVSFTAQAISAIIVTISNNRIGLIYYIVFQGLMFMGMGIGSISCLTLNGLCIDYDELMHSTRRESLFTTLAFTVMLIFLLVFSSICSALLQALGYVPGTSSSVYMPQQPPAVQLYLTIAVNYVPVVTFFLQVIIISYFPIADKSSKKKIEIALQRKRKEGILLLPSRVEQLFLKSANTKRFSKYRELHDNTSLSQYDKNSMNDRLTEYSQISLSTTEQDYLFQDNAINVYQEIFQRGTFLLLDINDIDIRKKENVNPATVSEEGHNSESSMIKSVSNTNTKNWNKEKFKHEEELSFPISFVQNHHISDYEREYYYFLHFSDRELILLATRGGVKIVRTRFFFNLTLLSVYFIILLVLTVMSMIQGRATQSSFLLSILAVESLPLCSNLFIYSSMGYLITIPSVKLRRAATFYCRQRDIDDKLIEKTFYLLDTKNQLKSITKTTFFVHFLCIVCIVIGVLLFFIEKDPGLLYPLSHLKY